MFWRDFSLAYWKYAHAHSAEGGPISNISTRKTILFGKATYEAFAYLDPLLGVHKETRKVYGDCDGGGTAEKESTAVYAAISEALERWAWHSCSKEKCLRFDIDPSSTGFAAFPGISQAAARTRALLEAAERWSLCAWWEKKLAHKEISLPERYSGLRGIELETSFKNTHVVILFTQAKPFAYGFAAAHSISEAIRRASIELFRNCHVLNLHPGVETTSQILGEHRLLFFSGEIGHSIFLNRVKNIVPQQSAVPKLIADTLVMGPWARYTTVWRSLFDNASLDVRNDQNDYFLF